MVNTLKKINESPVSTYRWLGVNECNIENRDFYEKKSQIHRSIKNKGNVVFSEELLGVETQILPSQIPMGESFRSYIDDNTNKVQVINIKEDTKEPMVFEYNLDKETYIEREKFILEEGVNGTFLFIQKGVGTHLGIREIHAKPGSTGKIIKVNFLEKDSLDVFETIVKAEKGSKIEIIHINLGSDVTVDNLNIHLEEEAEGSITGMYLAGNKDQLDMNYYLEHVGKNSSGDIDVKGVLDGEAQKIFRGTIDFKKGAKKANGREHEEVMLLSDKVRNRAIPLILCTEDDVYGEHSASCGRIDEDKLFYLMSRGLSLEESKKMMIEGNFNPILDKIAHQSIVDEIKSVIQRRVL
jgi:Fe-S cluster assembly scaffold protein SufB